LSTLARPERFELLTPGSSAESILLGLADPATERLAVDATSTRLDSAAASFPRFSVRWIAARPTRNRPRTARDTPDFQKSDGRSILHPAAGSGPRVAGNRMRFIEVGVVARGGIEPPTRGFSVASCRRTRGNFLAGSIFSLMRWQRTGLGTRGGACPPAKSGS
jgi:hypothetical protein